MPKLYRPEEVINVLESLGWRWVRTTGDHARLVLPAGQRPTTVPLSKPEVSRRTFQSILHQTGLSRKQFDAQAEEVL
jgi:predicted RNA binding protein YcfA (HicA-like mRNA interferase family)